MNGRLLATAAATLLLFTLPAHADTKSWTALKNKVPAGTNVVLSVDVSQIAKTSAFSLAVQAILDQESDVKQAVEAVKTGCGVDITTVVTDVTVMAIDGDSGGDRALIGVGVTGIDKAKVTACMGVIATLDNKDSKLTVKTKGKVTEYGVAGKDEKIYLGWATKDVLVFTSDPFKKGVLEKLLVGKAAKGNLKKYLAKTTSSSVMFFGVDKPEKEADIGTMLGGWGNVDLASGSLGFKATIVVDSDAGATKLATLFNDQVKEMVTKVQQQMPDFAKALGTTTATASGKDVTVTGSISEKTLVGLIPQLDKIF